MKKIILSVAVVATAAIAGWNYQQNQNKAEMSDLALDNVEALASGEGVGIACCHDIGDICEIGGSIAYDYDECFFY